MNIKTRKGDFVLLKSYQECPETGFIWDEKLSDKEFICKIIMMFNYGIGVNILNLSSKNYNLNKEDGWYYPNSKVKKNFGRKLSDEIKQQIVLEIL